MPPRSKEAFEAMRETSRNKIESAALTLFAKRGLSVKVEELAASAGISKGLLYSYYPSKEALIVALIGQATAKSAQAVLTAAQAQTDARDTIQAISHVMCEMFLSRAYRGVEYFMFMLQVGMSGFAVPAEASYSEALPNPAETLAGILARGQAEGTVVQGDAMQLSLTYWATIQGLCCHAILGMPVSPNPEMLNRLLLTEEGKL
jgi:AcrR family transcriptional regulator